MFSYFFRQLFNSFGIFFRTIRAFFTRRFVGMTARLRRMMNFSRHATQVASASFQGAAVALKKPTKREDYVETKRLFVSKSFILMLLIGLIALIALIYFVVWPFLLSRFFTAHFWQEDEKAADWSGRVVMYYDEEKKQPMYQGRLVEGVLQGKGKAYDEAGLVTYEGDFVDGMFTGGGSRFEDGVLVYEGDFLENQYHGEGTAYGKDGSLLYRGGFAEGTYYGEGKLYHPNGSELYAGGFAEGLYEGDGRLRDQDGQLVYEGAFQEGLFHGEGTLYSGGRRVYTGGFAKGLRDGEGREYLPEGPLRYKGGFAEDLYEGEGTLYLEDDRSYIEAVFAAGETDGDIRWYIDGKLWYAGGADNLLPDGYGEIYTRSGKMVYAGEMDRGTIDGQWILGLSAGEVREAFAEATVAEKIADDGGFFILNRELGLVVRCTLQSAESDTTVFSTWISRQDTEMAWQDQAMFAPWTGDLETDVRMNELLPWRDRNAFHLWVQALQEGGPSSQTQFEEHEMTKRRYFLDGWYCTAAIEENGELVMVSWTVDGQLTPADSGGLLDENVGMAQERLEALLDDIRRGDSGHTGEGHVGYLLTMAASPEEAKTLVDSLLELYENNQVLISLENSRSLLQGQLEQVQLLLSMGSGSQSQADELQRRLDELRLRISQCTANRDKALLVAQNITKADVSAYDLEPLLISFDPGALTNAELCAKAEEYALANAAGDGGVDVDALRVDVQAVRINLLVAYETLQYEIKLQGQAAEAVQEAAEGYARGSVGQTALSEAQLALSAATADVYVSLADFARQLNSLNHLTGGWLSQQVGWLDSVYELVYRSEPREPGVEDSQGDSSSGEGQDAGSSQQGQDAGS